MKPIASIASELSRSPDPEGTADHLSGLKETKSCDLARLASALALTGVANPLASIARSVDGIAGNIMPEQRSWSGEANLLAPLLVVP